MLIAVALLVPGAKMELLVLSAPIASEGFATAATAITFVSLPRELGHRAPSRMSAALTQVARLDTVLVGIHSSVLLHSKQALLV